MDLNVSTEQFIKGVTETLINSLTTDIRNQVVHDVAQHVTNFDLKEEIKSQINSAVARAVQSYSHFDKDLLLEPFANNPITNSIFTEFKTYTQTYLEQLVNHVKNHVAQDMIQKLNNIDIHGLAKDQIRVTLEQVLQNQTYQFPDSSIPGRSINLEGIQIKADNILAGTIKQFSSTGIQDLSSKTQVTILDTATVFENKIFVNTLEVNQDLIINGTINQEFNDRIISKVFETIKENYTDKMYDGYCDRVFDKITSQGIDPLHIKVEGQPIVTGATLNNKITHTNIQKLGVLKNLIVIGESYLDESLYVSNKKIGINTRDPERTLDIWDQEVQIVIAKRLKDVGFIGTLRNQKLILSSNNKDNLTLHPDGTISVKEIYIGNINHCSSKTKPTDNKPIGHVVWNEQPTIGSCVGWISLGGARWAKFGIIEDN